MIYSFFWFFLERVYFKFFGEEGKKLIFVLVVNRKGIFIFFLLEREIVRLLASSIGEGRRSGIYIVFIVSIEEGIEEMSLVLGFRLYVYGLVFVAFSVRVSFNI